jgi:hypothetical protein
MGRLSEEDVALDVQSALLRIFRDWKKNQPAA